jgi:hypothetical protein
MSDPNPYAPPANATLPALSRTPLPEGVRRFGLDVEGYRTLVAKALRARIVRSVLFALGYLALSVGWAPSVTTLLGVAVPVFGAWIVVSSLVVRASARHLERTVLRSYELLISPRVLRRAAYRRAPAEILAPEVTSIVEIPEGLSIASARPRRFLFVSCAVERFAEVRDHVRTWGPVEVRTGPRAYLRRLSHSFGERPRERGADGALRSDPTLREELRAVRALAMPFDPRTQGPRALPRVLGVAAVLSLMFLVVWRFLALAR